MFESVEVAVLLQIDYPRTKSEERASVDMDARMHINRW